MRRNMHSHEENSRTNMGYLITRTCYSALRTHCTPSSDGQTALLSRLGASYLSHWLRYELNFHRILGLVAVHAPTMPLHIACMHHLKHLHSRLFILAHELVEREPESPMSWYAVGVWYLTQQKWADARTYFRYVRCYYCTASRHTKDP